MIRHRPRTRGVAAQHASLSRWRSPVRIRSGPPSLFDSSHAPSARPDGAFLCPPTARNRSPVRYPAARDRARSRLQPEGPEAPRRDARRGSSRRSSIALVSRRGRRLRRRRARRPRRGSCVTDAATGRRRVGRPDRDAGRPDRDAGPGGDGQRGARVRGAVGIGGACRARRVGRGDRSRDELPVGSDSRADGGRTRDPGRRSARTRGLALVEADADAILATLGVTRDELGDALTTLDTADDLRAWPAEAPQGARVPARGRRRRVGPGALRGAPTRCSAWTGCRRWLTGRSPPACSCRRGPPGLRPGHGLDARRRRRHPPRPRRGAGDQGQGRRLPVRRRHGRHHRHLQGLLAVRLGPAVHRPDGQPRRHARSRQGRRPRDRELREPRPRHVPVPRQRDELHRQPRLHRGTHERGHRLGVAGQQPHR